MDPFADKSRTDLIALLVEQAQLIPLLQEQVEQLKHEIARLKGNKPEGGKQERELPAFVKPNQPTPPKKQRRKRAEAFGRRRATPTEEVVYACSHCPDCGRALSGGSQYSRRQIIELPEIAVRVVDHVLVSRYCGICQKRCTPIVDWSATAVGRSMFGPAVHSLVAYLRQVGRLPIRTIATVLSALCRLKISDGYLWSFSTPSVCYFTYPKSRSGRSCSFRCC